VTCAICGQGEHRFGTTDSEHDYDAMACVWKLNNSFTSLAARRLVAMDPTLRDVIEMRGRR